MTFIDEQLKHLKILWFLIQSEVKTFRELKLGQKPNGSDSRMSPVPCLEG